MPDETIQLAVIQNDINRMKDDVKDIKQSISSNYVTQEEFRPIKIFVYGLIALALAALGTAIFKMVIS